MRLDVITIFPDYLAPLDTALLGRAHHKGIISTHVHDLRQWTHDVHHAVDDTPFGGGPGMVMLPHIWWRALSAVAGLPTSPTSASAHRDDVHSQAPLLIVPTPAGARFTQQMAADFATREHLIFACGRYEGIDQRVIDAAAQHLEVAEVSLGDYVLIGGEVAVLAITEAVVRLLPGVLGNSRSAAEDSFQDGLLEGPAYTRPEVWEGYRVPEVLTTGNHGKIAQWRREQSLLRTATRRPELLATVQLDTTDREFLRAAGFGALLDNLPH